MCVADASDYARQGSSYADFRLHYMMELFSLNLTEVYFTTAAEGETLTRYTHIREKDLILATVPMQRGRGSSMFWTVMRISCFVCALRVFPSILRQVRGMTLQRC